MQSGKWYKGSVIRFHLCMFIPEQNIETFAWTRGMPSPLLISSISRDKGTAALNAPVRGVRTSLNAALVIVLLYVSGQERLKHFTSL